MTLAPGVPGPTLIDLFAGCGGMTRGFVDAGFTPVLAVENDLHAAATYAVNFGEDHALLADIADVTPGMVPHADVVIGGPSCQGFSNLGAKDPQDPRNQLWREYLRIVGIARPRVFVVENVPPFLDSPEFAALCAETNGGVLDGYTLESGVLNAADYGVAQRRRRAIVIGSRVGHIELPQATHRAPGVVEGTGMAGMGARSSASDSGANTGVPILPPWQGVGTRIAGLPERPATTALPDRTTTVLGADIPGVFQWYDIHVGRNPTALSLERYDHVPPGGGRFDIPAELLPRCWRDKPTGTTDVMGRMRWDAPSLTIRTEFFKPEKGAYLHPQWDAHAHPHPAYDNGKSAHRVNRPITHLEAALIQDFPANYKWCGTKISIARQIGNAVPVGLANAVARHILPYLE
jgi:DNA (cytosine-5)-methyltransferase 1